MCGIYGILDYSAKLQIDDNLLRAIGNTTRHRGPDDEGTYLKKDKALSVGFGHRRLSIIDLSSAGKQPMHNEDGSVWIVFNGEIYNYKELRVDLKNKGHKFISDTDTEVLIHLYEEYGKECVRFLRGMFAFAIWDEKTQSLLLARDRIGKKPLLYAYNDGIFCFASEFLAILESGLIKKNINYEAVHYYLTFKYVPAPLTIYEEVFKLPPAHRLILKDKKINLEKYWELDYSQKIKISEEEAAEETLRLLKESINIRLRSDVSLGAFLSGGIDSSVVVSLMSQLSDKEVRTFSIGFNEEDYNELKYAKNIAGRFNTQHHEFIVKPDALGVLPLLVEHYGEPYADSSCIPTYYLSKQTKQYVTVALSGDGGDELFAGYDRYQAMLLADFYQRMPSVIKYLISNVIKALPNSINSKSTFNRLKRLNEGIDLPILQRYLRWIGVFNDALKKDVYTEDFLKLTHFFNAVDIIKLSLNKLSRVSLLDSLLWTDTLTYLPDDLLVKVDIASMANSLEIRSPFLDHKLIEFIAKLPAEYKMKRFIKKYILKKIIKDMIPKENVQRKKMGFAVPIGEWFRGELKDFLYTTILSKKFFNRGYFKPQAIKNMVSQHIHKQRDYTSQLWALLMLELWYQRFID